MKFKKNLEEINVYSSFLLMAFESFLLSVK